jgi:hypothetical protein
MADAAKRVLVNPEPIKVVTQRYAKLALASFSVYTLPRNKLLDPVGEFKLTV